MADTIQGGNAEARSVIATHFKAGWDAITPTVPQVIYDDVEDDTPSGDVSWAKVTIEHVDSEQQTLAEEGGRRFNKNGIITVQIFTKSGDGLKEAYRLADIAEKIFKGKKTTNGAIWFRNVVTNEVGVRDAWWQNNVVVEFTYDEIL